MFRNPFHTRNKQAAKRRGRMQLRLESFEDRTLLAAGASFFAGTAGLLKDINTGTGDAFGGIVSTSTIGVDSGQALSVGGMSFFGADDGVHGAELWKSDGTAGGTALIKDLVPGAGSSAPSQLTNVNGTIFFTVVIGGVGGDEPPNIGPFYPYPQVPLAGLMKTDGTPSGTVLIKTFPGCSTDPNQGCGDSISGLTNVGGTLFFTANDGTSGTELWKSNGTPDGTVMVMDIIAGSEGSSPANLTNFNGTLVFATIGYQPSGLVYYLWKSNGMSTGTQKIQLQGQAGSATVQWGYIGLEAAAVVGNTLFFVADDGTRGAELWKTDGTNPGTVMVKDINPGSTNGMPNSSTPMNLTNLGGTLFFSADDGAHGRELWKSDGAGTVLVKDINPGITGSNPRGLVVPNDGVIFVADDGTHGPSLWKTDGTAAGTVLVSANVPPAIFDLCTIQDNTVCFTAADGTHGRELWKTDGTTRGTVMVADINPGGPGSNPMHLTDVNGTLFFEALDGKHGVELWKSDGTAAGTMLVKDINAAPGDSNIQVLAELKGNTLFAANDGIHGRSLWKTNGTAAGTVLVSGDVSPAIRYQLRSKTTEAKVVLGVAILSDIETYLAVTVNDTLFFAGRSALLSYNASADLEGLWKTDGTTAGTVLVKRFSSPLQDLTRFNGQVYFVASTDTDGVGLWTSDGTTAGTMLIKRFSSPPQNLTSFDGQVYFVAPNSSGSMVLFKSDGTAAGTVPVDPTGAETNPSNLAVVGDTLFFTAFDSVNGTELWMSRPPFKIGENESPRPVTTMVKDINPGTSSSSPSGLISFNGTLFFVANDGPHGAELWKSDGTTNGTALVKDIFPGIAPGPLTLNGETGNDSINGVGGADTFSVAVDDKLFFAADDGMHGRELWSSDGTTAGTAMVADMKPGDLSSNPMELIPANGTLYFTADDGIHGRTLFAVGTEAGALPRRVQDSADNQVNNVMNLASVGGTVFFSAFGADAANGRELWRTPLQAAAATVQVTASPNPVKVGQILTLSITVNGGDDTPTGMVIVDRGGRILGTAKLDNTGKASINTGPTTISGGDGADSLLAGGGNDTITAVYSGDSNFATASGSVNVTIIGPTTPTGGVPPTASPNEIITGSFFASLLGRNVDPGGLTTFSLMLNSGATASMVAMSLLNSQEGRQRSVHGLYGEFLHRNADQAGLNTFTRFLEAGGALQQLKAQFLGSPEYFQTRGMSNNTTYLDAIFGDLLRRPMDPTGRTFFTDQLNAGMSRDRVAAVVQGSLEAQQALVQNLYRRHLGRTADPVGLASWVKVLAQQGGEQRVLAGLVASDEYLNRI